MTDTKESLTKGFVMIEDSMENAGLRVLESVRDLLGSISRIQEQLENITRIQLNQNKVIREELLKLAEDLSKQMSSNQAQFRKMVEESMMNTNEQTSSSSQSPVADLSAKVDKPSKEVAMEKEVKAGKKQQPLVTA